MKNNSIQNKFYLLYLYGFFLISALHILDLPPLFFPTDWAKTIVFRTIMAILLFLFAFQLLYRRNELSLPDIKKNRVVWALIALSAVFLLASIFSTDPYFSFWGSPARAGGFVNFAFYATFAVFTFLIVRKEDWKKIWNFSIFIGIIVSALAIIQNYGLFSKIFVPVSSQPPSTIGNPIMLGTYLLLLFFITLSFALKEKRLAYKLFYFFCLALFFYVILIAESRAAYLGLLVAALYFFLSYPKKIKIIKIGIISVLIAVIGIVLYSNFSGQFPKFLEKNKLFQRVEPQLSINKFLNDARFSAWKVGLQALKEKPVLGWGPENFQIGFDKYYDPSIPHLGDSNWWDKPHNAFLETAITAGIPALFIYVAFFAVLFWELEKTKRKSEDMNAKIIISGVQAALIGYWVAIFFSFDNASTYILFFTLAGFSMHLIYPNNADQNQQLPLKQTKGRGIITAILLIMLLIFLWQYNFAPQQNSILINRANSLAKAQKCDQAFALMDGAVKNHNFLDSYLRLKYVELIKACARLHPENNLAYAKKGAELLKEALKVQPLYTRSWIFLGAFTAITAENEQNPATKQSQIDETNSYFNQAYKLSPKRQEIFVEWAKLDIVTGNYQAMKQKAEKCIALNPALGDCYWTRAISEIYLKEDDKAKKDIKNAEADIGFNEFPLLGQLMDAYIPPQQFNEELATENYQALVPIYQKLIDIKPNFAQYHSSLAFVYSKLKEYQMARNEALIYWKITGDKEEVKAFLSTLPKEFSVLPDKYPE